MRATLTREDIGRGLEALFQTLGPDKMKVFLDFVASGALDPSLVTKGRAFIRRNPEVLQAGAQLLGGFLAGLVAVQSTKRNSSRRSLEMLRNVLSTHLGTPLAVRPQDHGPEPEPEIIDVEVIDSTPIK